MDRIQGKNISMTMDKVEYNRCANTIEIMNTRLCLEKRIAKIEKYHGSGTVVIMIAIKTEKDSIVSTG